MKFFRSGWFVALLLLVALFLRSYRVSEITGFYFDQGRDAKVIWNLWHTGKFFLVGPTTGIEGIFLGPTYYYLIAPLYLLGNGNPAAVSFFLAVLNVLGIFVIYRIGRAYFYPASGLMAAALVTFSLQLTQDHRWLSNPTPLPLTAALSVWLLLRLVHGSSRWQHWGLLGLLLGLSLHFEAASAVFFLPAVGLVFLIFRRHISWHHTRLLLLFAAFALTLIPQLLFNFRHQNLLVNSFNRFLVAEKSFAPSGSDFYPQR